VTAHSAARRVWWAVFLATALQLTGLGLALAGNPAGRALVACGVAATALASCAGLWLTGRRAVAGASVVFLGVGVAGLVVVTTAAPAPSCGEDLLCHQRRYAGVVERDGVASAFATLRAAQTSESYDRRHCHQLTHAIGRAAGAAAPDLAAAFAQAQELCGTGYWHGVMETAVVSAPDGAVDAFCTPIRTAGLHSVAHQGCAHGLGHGFMNAHDGDLSAALLACDELSDPWEREYCYNGVFMENIPDDDNPAAGATLRPDDPLYPCTAIAPHYRGQCLQKQTSYALAVRDGDFAAVFALCAGLGPAERPACDQGLGRNAFEQSVRERSGPVRVAALCGLAPDTAAGADCVYGAARYLALFHADRAAATPLCAALGPDLAAACERGAATYG
jgi:hypothetical protein